MIPAGAGSGDLISSAFAAARTGHGWRQTDGHIQAAELRVMECLDAAAEKFHIAPERCFLAGYRCGGTMAFRIALRNPQCFAGVISISGPFPSGRAPLAQLHDVRRLEVFVACARASTLYPTETVCHDLRLLHTAGMSVILREYPGDDSLAPQMLADMDRWIMEQVTGNGGQGTGDREQGAAVGRPGLTMPLTRGERRVRYFLDASIAFEASSGTSQRALTFAGQFVYKPRPICLVLFLCRVRGTVDRSSSTFCSHAPPPWCASAHLPRRSIE